MIERQWRIWFIGALLGVLIGCSETPFNSPYPNDPEASETYYTSFTERPKHLDPAKSYSSNEWALIGQILEPPLQYNYFQRPYTLEPLLLTEMPTIRYLSPNGRSLPPEQAHKASKVAYELHFRQDIRYQPHPAFVLDDDGNYRYHNLTEESVANWDGIEDFPEMHTRYLRADDVAYQIKRLAHVKNQSPIYTLMAEYIEGFADFREASANFPLREMNTVPLSGVNVLDEHTLRITLSKPYPQFVYWLTMPFFAPMPPEVDRFYDQTVLRDKNIQLDWYPVGTGPYRIVDNNPNLRIRLSKNPNYRNDYFPKAPEGLAGFDDREGRLLPLVDTIDFIMEKESIPYWNKFLQGYYDSSGIQSDTFDEAVQASAAGPGLSVTPALAEKGIRLQTQVQPSTFYWGFNWLDPVVGGDADDKRALRQALSIALDTEEYIQIFMNGRGQVAHHPIPPAIYENACLHNPITHRLNDKGEPVRRSLEEAKARLAEAGYPNGIDPTTQKPLTLFFDTMGNGSPDARARLVWFRKQFNKLGIDLIVRETQYNRFQDKMKNGTAQFFGWGWNADYPDPENFLFLLYGPNAKALYHGENAANYNSKDYNRAFEQMETARNDSEREAAILDMVRIVQIDSPWIFGVHPHSYSLYHGWVSPTIPNTMSRNTLKYLDIDPHDRAEKRRAWNHPHGFGLLLMLLVLLITCAPAWYRYRQMQQGAVPRKEKV